MINTCHLGVFLFCFFGFFGVFFELESYSGIILAIMLELKELTWGEHFISDPLHKANLIQADSRRIMIYPEHSIQFTTTLYLSLQS